MIDEGQLWRSRKNRPYPTVQEWAQAVATVSHPHNLWVYKEDYSSPRWATTGKYLSSVCSSICPFHLPSPAFGESSPSSQERKRWLPNMTCQDPFVRESPSSYFPPGFFHIPSCVDNKFSPGFWVFNVRNCLDFSWMFFLHTFDI